jgi:hypothetical protein
MNLSSKKSKQRRHQYSPSQHS